MQGCATAGEDYLSLSFYLTSLRLFSIVARVKKGFLIGFGDKNQKAGNVSNRFLRVHSQL